MLSSTHSLKNGYALKPNAANAFLSKLGYTCPKLSCGSDLWNDAAEERSPLFS